MSVVSNTNPASVTISNTFPSGTNVTLFNTTEMTQIAGMTFTIDNATSMGFDLLGLDASSFANPSTNVEMTLATWPKNTQPQFNYITKIQTGINTTLTFSTIHRYIPKQLIKISVPRSFGMQEIDQRTVEIISVTPYEVVVALDSWYFSPFSFPPSNPFSILPQGYITPLFATVAPAGARNTYDLNYIPFQPYG